MLHFLLRFLAALVAERRFPAGFSVGLAEPYNPTFRLAAR
jgi:hypothetical protein